MRSLSKWMNGLWLAVLLHNVAVVAFLIGRYGWGSAPCS